MNPFDAASPLDARYYLAESDFFQRLHPYVSEAAQVKYLARVEGALAETLAAQGVCSPAVVNCIRNKISPAARPFVHLFATSADIMDSARALCLREVTRDVLLPDLGELLQKLIRLARAHADTPQMGRTHGQHAVPITFGFAVALYVSRLGQRIETIDWATQDLRGNLPAPSGL